MAMVERLTIIRGVEKFELQTKTARWVLAKEEGYSPVQMLVSAIGACGGYVYQSVLENSHIPFEFE
ncbi:OsmC family peroxiredoxin, partial [Enterococcus faecium]